MEGNAGRPRGPHAGHVRDGPPVVRRRRGPASLRAAGDMAWRHPHPRSTARVGLRCARAPAVARRRRRPLARLARLHLAGVAMSRDTSFYYSFLVLPPRKRAAILAVWDFCRAVDDAVDEVVPEAEWQGGLTADARLRATARLAAWRAELDAVYTGTPRTSQGLALQPSAREFSLPRRQFDDLIDGDEMDLAHARYQTFDALSEYCRRVASTVGLICIEIFGYRDRRTRAYAV